MENNKIVKINFKQPEDKLIPGFIDFHERDKEDRKWLNQLFSNS